MDRCIAGYFCSIQNVDIDSDVCFPSQTIGAAFGAKKVSVQGESVTLGIWVRSGQQKGISGLEYGW